MRSCTWLGVKYQNYVKKILFVSSPGFSRYVLWFWCDVLLFFFAFKFFFSHQFFFLILVSHLNFFLLPSSACQAVGKVKKKETRERFKQVQCEVHLICFEYFFFGNNVVKSNERKSEENWDVNILTAIVAYSLSYL